MPDVVDPRPVIDQKLSALVAEYQPKLDALERAVSEANGETKRAARAELRAMKRRYAAARREIANLGGRIATW
jgi:hypothetical protein